MQYLHDAFYGKKMGFYMYTLKMQRILRFPTVFFPLLGLINYVQQI